MIPVVAITGHLGSGKTTLLNHLLRRPGARVGVVVNDVGAINVDAALLVGQVTQAASITGGCVCCMPGGGGLDDALTRLSDPRLRLDAILFEASGLADPQVLSRLIRTSTARRVRRGGLVDVVDAAWHATTIDTRPDPPARYAAATLAVVTKLDLVAPDARDDVLAHLTARIHARNPAVTVLAAPHGRIDPTLVFDVADDEDPPDQLPLAALARAGHHHGDHGHAVAVTSLAGGPADARALVDLLEDPPRGVYRLKGVVPVRTAAGPRRYLVNLVARTVHVALAPRRRVGAGEGAGEGEGLVAIGVDLDRAEVQARLDAALRPSPGELDAAGYARLQRHQRLSR